MTEPQSARNSSVDTLRGLCILAVVTVHALLLVAPRAVHLRCDVLGPAHLACGFANAYSFLIANVFAVCVFAFLSGLVISGELRIPDCVKRCLRLHLAALMACILTAFVLMSDTIDTTRLARLFAPLPFTKPTELSLLLEPDWQQIVLLGIGFKYPAIALDTAYHLDRLWPPIWCIPWFLAGWIIIFILKRFTRGSDWYLAIAAVVALPFSDQGIISSMIVGYLAKPFTGRLRSWVAATLLLTGLGLAAMPFVRVVSSDWILLAAPIWLASIVQTVAASLTAIGFLHLCQSPQIGFLCWIGRHSLPIYALHWPALIVVFGLLLSLHTPANWLANAALGFAVLPVLLGIVALSARAPSNRVNPKVDRQKRTVPR